jgi:DNA repair exonuclease SbcCD ATPase subunit
MIVFQSLKWRNFLSAGNNWCQLDFQSAKTTLVVGQNGAGKSTMLDALSFALFGKAHRNISKAQLVNSINGKGCEVEVTFNVLGSDFRIVRGIKPNKFEIWRGETMLNQDSHAKEYQKVLEQNILKLNHKSFHQIVVLGSSSFVPFMQLSSGNRRDVIEDLLDINVFSKMNGILKEKQSLLKDSIKNVIHQHDVTTTKVDAQKKYIKDVKAINEEQREEKLKLISDFRYEIETLQGSNKELSDSIQSQLPNSDAERKQHEAKIKDIEAYKTKFNIEVKKIVKDVQFFEKNDICPTCDQTITEDTKEAHVLEGKARAKELQAGITKADEGLRTAQDALLVANAIIEKCREYQSTLAANNQSISQFQSSIDRTQGEIDKLNNNVDIDAAIKDLDDLTSAVNTLVEERLVLNEQFNYNMVMSQMLKDTGIKTKIIKQYLPVINKLVNQFLQILDFFVSFNLDEAFQETIKSRYRDNFTYDSFSEGEKQRIDLALLFTWRQIAKMKNSVATNLLILDETFDSSLDHDGVDNLMKIIYALGDDTNIFVISHKGEVLDGKFSKKIEVVKEKNFSKIKEVNNGTI